MARRGSNIDLEKAKRRYLQALLAGDLDAASEVVAKLAAAKIVLADVYMNVLAPAMGTIGDLWCESKINVAQEHLATQITLAQMEKLRLMQSVPRPAPYAVIVACVEGESHFLGARMAGDLFQLEGWSVDFLGPNVPTRALVEIVEARRPNLLGLSVTLESNRKATRVLLKSLMTISDRPKLIVGGCVGGRGGSWTSEFEGVQTTTNVVDGVTLARKFFNPSRPRVLLSEYLKEFGQKIRALRQQMGWTQENLATVTKLTRAYLVSVEGGKENITMDVVVRIANALNVPPNQLLGRGQLDKVMADPRAT
jgi:methanogenic corrinoid protein MtbC1/DNA-binding XRE family transcriptional regulator